MSTMETASSIAPAAFIPPVVPSAPPAGPAIYRFSVDEYHRMFEIGVLNELSRVELLEGIICKMMTPIGTQHGLCVELARKAWERHLSIDFSVWSQQSITTKTSEPQPDVYVARGEHRKYVDRHPGPLDLVVVIEVADTSLALDRNDKQIIYAKAGIAEYWIVNIPERKLEVYRRPLSATADSVARYETTELLTEEQSVEIMLDGAKLGLVAVRDILP